MPTKSFFHIGCRTGKRNRTFHGNLSRYRNTNCIVLAFCIGRYVEKEDGRRTAAHTTRPPKKLGVFVLSGLKFKF